MKFKKIQFKLPKLFSKKRNDLLSKNFDDVYDEQIKKEKKFKKQNWLLVLNGLLFLILGNQLNQFFFQKSFSGFQMTFLFMFLIMTITNLYIILIVFDFKKLNITGLISLVCFLLPFAGIMYSFDFFCLILLLLGWGLITWGAKIMRNRERNLIEFNLRQILRSGSKFVLIGLFSIILVLFYQSYSVQNQKSNTLAGYLIYTNNVVGEMFSINMFNSNVDNVFSQILSISPATRGLVSNYGESSVDLLKQSFEAVTNIQIQGDNVGEVIESYYNSAKIQTKLIILIVLLSGIGLFLYALAIILNFFVYLLSALTIKLLFKLNILTFKEIIIYKKELTLK